MKMNIRIFGNIVMAALAGLLALTSCKKNGPDYSKMAEPEFSLILDQMTPDMNTVDNIPVVCVIRSEAGLQQVRMYLVSGTDETLYTTITKFHDPHQFSLKESPKWTEDITDIRIEALDNGNRVKSVTLEVKITPYQPAPTVEFEYDKIVIDETKGSSESPVTRFTVTSPTKITGIEVNLFRRDGITKIGLTPAFTPRQEYRFEQQIDYIEGDTALQVAATDEYGKVKIETLPITYIAVPSPVLTPSGSTSTDPIIAHSGDTRSMSFNFVSEGGAVAAKTLKYVKGSWVEIQELYKELGNVGRGEYSVTLPAFESNWNAVKFQIIDRLGRMGEVEVKTIIDMRAVIEQRVGAQAWAKVGSEDYPDAHPFYSIRDLNSITLYQAYEETRNVDFVFYYFNNGNPGGTVRFYDAMANRPDGEWPEQMDAAAGIPSYNTWSGRNATTRRKFDPSRFSFNFDTVTADDLLGSAVQNRLNEGQTNPDFCDFVNGDVVLFKTGPLSTCPNTTGIIRFERLDKNTTSGNYSKGYYIVSIKVVDNK